VQWRPLSATTSSRPNMCHYQCRGTCCCPHQPHCSGACCWPQSFQPLLVPTHVTNNASSTSSTPPSLYKRRSKHCRQWPLDGTGPKAPQNHNQPGHMAHMMILHMTYCALQQRLYCASTQAIPRA
jgi:hypothetical protein